MLWIYCNSTDKHSLTIRFSTNTRYGSTDVQALTPPIALIVPVWNNPCIQTKTKQVKYENIQHKYGYSTNFNTTFTSKLVLCRLYAGFMQVVAGCISTEPRSWGGIPKFVSDEEFKLTFLFRVCWSSLTLLSISTYIFAYNFYFILI